MYIEFILILIIILVLYFYVFNDNRILVEAYDNNKYLVVKAEDKNLLKQKADTLAKLKKVALTLANKMKTNKIPTAEVANRLYTRLNKIKFTEPKMGDESTAYTLNKDQEISICLIDKITLKIIEFELLVFVLLHELAHVMSVGLGHGEEFQRFFSFIVKLAIKLGLWKDLKFEKENKDICGTMVTTSPCSESGVSCNSNELDEFFKESLLN